MKEIFPLAFLTGLSTGIYCFLFCFPFLTPLVLSEEKRKRENLFLVLKFLFGRLAGYIVFGAVFGFLGEKIESSFFDLASKISLMALSLLLIFHSLGFLKEKFKFCAHFRKANPSIPFLMGFLNGVNICPPFLISLNYVFILHKAVFGIFYFLTFFFATSLYFLPFFFLGFLNKMKEFQTIGRISAFLVGIIFFIYSLFSIFQGKISFHKI